MRKGLNAFRVCEGEDVRATIPRPHALTLPPKEHVMPKLSRAKRWAAAVADVRTALEHLTDAKGELEDAASALHDLRQEYGDWYDSMPEGLQSSPTAEKLSEVSTLDDIPVDSLQEAINDLESAADDYENADLPRGFGRD